jgi:Xaa-Pro aminopeptidase
MPDIAAIQAELRSSGLDGWLFYDILHRDPIAYSVLGLHDVLAKRRWFYLIPAQGRPAKLVHKIEAGTLDSLPGAKIEYMSREELLRGLGKLLGRMSKVAMQYSPKSNITSVATVDAGTVELVRSMGCKVVTSADLVQKFEAAWTPEQLRSHLEAGRLVDRITQDAFRRAASFVREKKVRTEYELQQWMAEQFKLHDLVSDSAPIVGAGPSSGNPHYEPARHNSRPIRAGNVLLLDVWAKLNKPGSVYYDITWTAYLGSRVPAKVEKVFRAVTQARDAAVDFAQRSIAAGRNIHGWQVDRAARDVIRKAGFAKYFTHRTGHNIGQEVHGTGANMDGIEMHDDRSIVPRTCFSVEPGIYLPEFGIRSEVDVYVSESETTVTGAVQTEMPALLA